MRACELVKVYANDQVIQWEDIKWEVKHFNGVERVAIVGEENWQKWMAGFCNAFTTAEVRYFTFAQIYSVHAWLNEYAEPRP